MERIFNEMKNLEDTLFVDAREFINRQKRYNNMNKQIKITALTEEGTSIVSGWFTDVNKGEEYATAMAARGYVVVKQYR